MNECACICHLVYREMERQGYFEVYWTPDYEIPYFPRHTHTHTHTHVTAAQRGLGTAQRLTSQFLRTANTRTVSSGLSHSAVWQVAFKHI